MRCPSGVMGIPGKSGALGCEGLARWAMADVSDKPLHGEIKLPGMANHFYRERVDQHLRIGMRAIDLLRAEGSSQLHSRKLRSFSEVAFQ